jgi:hypothetical protein
MARMSKAIGKMNLDKGGAPGDHMWVVKNAFLSENGYEQHPVAASVTTFGAGQTPQGIFRWRGAAGDRTYVALSSTIWELYNSTSTDVSGAAYTNTTNGMTFAAYGEHCFASNGVDDIQVILVPGSIGASTNFADMVYTSTGAEIAPKYICSHKNHLIGANIKMRASYQQISTHTTGVGTAFTNQPTGDTVEILSTSGADTMLCTIYGTTQGGGDTVTTEQITLLGLSVATTVKTNWGLILGIGLASNAAGTITFREGSGDLAITTIAPAASTSGISTVAAASTSMGGNLVDIVSNGATTRQVGFIGTDTNGVAQTDSQALSGTTTVQTNSRFNTITYVLIGDVEAARTVTIKSHAYPSGVSYPYDVWISGTEDPEGFGIPAVSSTIVGAEVLRLFDGVGEVTGVVDGGDCFFVFKEGSIYRIDGPPFSQTVVESSVGMPVGCNLYRQGSRVYFWANSGLCYIDINTNEVVNLFKGRMLRAVTDWANANFGLSMGTYPITNGTTINEENVANTEGAAKISGDSAYGFVYVNYWNQSLGKGLLLYQSAEDCFVVLNQPLNGTLGVMVEEDPYSNSLTQYPGSGLRMVVDSGSSNEIFKWSITALKDRGDDDLPYLRWPFDRFGPSDAKGRVAKVRPVFDNASVSGDNDLFTGTTVNVITVSGVGKHWANDGKAAVSIGTSLDGWYSISSSLVGDSHSIGVIIDETTTAKTSLVNFSGIDVDFVQGPGRSK